MAFALPMIQFVLLMACAQSTHIIAATRDTSCVVSREQLAAAVALVANLEAQLQEARQTVVAKGLEVGSCELGASTTASEHSKTAPRRTNGPDDFSCSSECGRVLRPHRFRSIYVNPWLATPHFPSALSARPFRPPFPPALSARPFRPPARTFRVQSSAGSAIRRCTPLRVSPT